MSRVLDYTFQQFVTDSYKLPIYISDSEIKDLICGRIIDISTRSYHENSYLCLEGNQFKIKQYDYGTETETTDDW